MSIEDRKMPLGMGMTDSRPQIAATQGGLIDRPDPRFYDPMPLRIGEFTEEGIAFLERESHDPSSVIRVKRGIEALDLLVGVEFTQKRRILALFLEQEIGDYTILKRFLGVLTKGDVNRVIADALQDDLLKQFGLVNYLIQPKILEILRKKREGMSHGQIAQEEDLSKAQVSEISRRLNLGGLIKPSNSGNAQSADDYRLFCDQIAALRNRGMTNFKISTLLKISANRVERATEHLIAIGEIYAIDPNDAIAKLPERVERELLRQKIFELRRKKMKAPDIAADLGVSEKIIHTVLFKGKGAPRIRQARVEQKEILRQILNSHMKLHGNNRISFEAIRELGTIIAGRGTLRSLYLEIAAEQEVPPYRNKKERKEETLDVFVSD